MRYHRFLIGAPLTEGTIILTESDLVHQMRTVLRLTVGSTVILMDGKGLEAEALIERIGKSDIEVHIGAVQEIETEPQRKVTLFCSILRRENFEWVVQKATEVGAVKIVPVIAERTVKTGIRMDRLVRIAREAVEQCGRGVVPEIADPVEYSDALSMAPVQNVFFHLGTPDGVWDKTLQGALEAGVWIGPEGGWTDAEAEKAMQRGFTVASLGSLALRAETAAVVGAYLAIHA